MDITYQYTKLRSNFGAQPLFCEQGPELCDNIPVNIAEHKQFILRNPVHQSVQHGPRFSQCEINTIRAEYTTSGCNHAEGGWPKDVVITDPESTQRYRRRVEKDDDYINLIAATAGPMEKLILQNNAIDMYQTYFIEMPKQNDVVRISGRTVNTYRDLLASSGGHERRVSSICWRPDGGQKFAVAYNIVDFDRKPLASTECCVWDTENPNNAEVSFLPPAVVIDLQYNERDIQVLGGGLINGQVAVWDQRETMTRPSLMCPPHVAHRDLVSGLRFNYSKTGKEFFSGGPDGVCKWWDMRNISEPIDEVMIHVVPNTNVKQSMALTDGVTCLEFEPTMPSRFMVGTENGFVINGNRKGKTPVEKLPAKMISHLGPVWTLQRNPGFLKNYLTVGDWTARIWSEECKESAVLWSPPQRYKICDGAWSPTRLSLLLLAHSDGVLALWDLLKSQYEPVLTIQVCKEPLLRIAPHDAGSLVACGNSAGCIYLTQLSSTLSETEKHEKGLLTVMFEREAKRERILEARMREIRVKMRQLEEMGGVEAKTSVTSLPGAVGDKDLAEATNEYFQTVKKEMGQF